MLNYILRRILVLPVIMFIVSSILFLLILQLPVETRVEIYLPSGNPHKTDEEAAKVMQTYIERYGLDQPFYIQYKNWVSNLFHGDWGYSPTWRQPVLQGLLQKAPATIELGMFAMVPSVLLAIVLGRLAAKSQYRFSDYAVRMSAFVGWAFPSFILGLILMNIFYARLRWFPPERLSVWANAIVTSGDFQSYTGLLTIDGLLNGEVRLSLDALRHLILPGITLAIFQWALFVRIMRTSLVDVLQQEYITTARSKGLPERAILNLHAGRNAILPLISSVGVTMSTLVTSVVVIEVLFSFNGVGRWVITAILSFDVPVAVGFVLLSSIFAVLASLVADILYAIIDPRVRAD